MNFDEEAYRLLVRALQDPQTKDDAMQHPVLRPVLEKLSADDFDTLVRVANAAPAGSHCNPIAPDDDTLTG